MRLSWHHYEGHHVDCLRFRSIDLIGLLINLVVPIDNSVDSVDSVKSVDTLIVSMDNLIHSIYNSVIPIDNFIDSIDSIRSINHSIDRMHHDCKIIA
jgi:hypothetical protein